MPMNKLISSAMLFVALSFSGAVFAQASITESTGNLLIKQQNQYVNLGGEVRSLPAGTEIVVPEGSSVALTLADGSIVTVAGGNSFIVPGAAAKLALVPIVTTSSGFAIGATGWAALAAGVGIAGYTIVDNTDSDSPSSP